MSKSTTLEIASAGQMSGTSSQRDAGNTPEHSEKPALTEKVFKVQVGIPLKGGTPARSYHDRMLMWKTLGNTEASDFYTHKNPRYVFQMAATAEMFVPYAREQLAEGTLASGCDYLFMVDDDMLAPPDLFYKLVANDKDICAALAFTRNPDHMPVVYETVEGIDPLTTRYGFTRFVKNYPRDTLFECDAIGFGAVLIKADVLRNVKRPWFFGMEGTGEDITFCNKAKKAGFQVWMDSRIKLGHLSMPSIITEEYSDAWNKLDAEQRDKLYGQFTKYQTDNLK